ncbi:MAG: energy-coupling factor ABC transporter permease, partial [Methanosphaera sp.]|nr:energy-coupling factor ABC transporter permease [Methanosphaera sp.]
FCSPYAAIIVLSVVLILQALFFGDGGITALGANIVNMAIVGGFVGYYGFTGLKDKIGLYPSIFIAAWAGCFIAALVAAVEMALSGTFPLDLGLFYMGGYHAMIGFIEAIITVIIIKGIDSVRPDLLSWNR